MEIGLKERLIGAIVLVVIAVIVIPFVLKGPAPDTTVTRPLPLPAAASTTPPAEYRMPLVAAAPQSSGTAAANPDTQPAAASSPVAPAQNAVPSAPQPAPAVNEAPPPVPARVIQRHAPAAPVRGSGKWTVQAGSFGSETNARKVQRVLESRGYHAYISRYRSKGREYYRVRVGAYAERATAERAAREIARAYGGKASAVPNS